FPSEVRKLGIAVRPWKVTDSMAIGEMMARRFGGGGGGELRNLQILALLKGLFGERAPQVLDDLAPQNDPAAPATIPASEAGRDPLRDQSGRVEERKSGRSGPKLPLLHSSTLPFLRSQWSLIPTHPADLERGRAAAELEAELAFARANGLPTKWGS